MPLELVHNLIDSRRHTTEDVAMLCTNVRLMVPPSSKIQIDQANIFLVQLETFPSSTHQDRIMSANAIASWVMLTHLCNR